MWRRLLGVYGDKLRFEQCWHIEAHGGVSPCGGSTMQYQTTAAARRGAESCEIMGQLAIESAKVAVKGVKHATRAIKKWNNYRPARYKLLNCPAPDDVLAQWSKIQRRRNVLEALRFGAMLLNVSQYVDCSPIYGRGKHIVARNPGLKGWLRSACPGITYVTAMSYRKLAEITCKVIHLPEFIPLDWVMPGTEAMDETRELNPENKLSMKLKRGEFLRQIRVCREELSKLLEGTSNVNQLFAKLDERTHEHRHRLHVKITVCPTGEKAGRILGRQLQAALQVAQSLPESLSGEEKQVLLRLLTDLQEKIQTHSA